MVPLPDPANSSETDSKPLDFESVFRAHHQGLCEFVTAIVGSSEIARELVQDLFLRLWELQDTPAAPPLTRAYLFTAARNRALRHLRRQRVQRRWEDRITRELDPPAESADVGLRQREVAQAVERAVAELPERCRLVFTLSRRDHLSYAEIAQVMEISISTVEAHMWRALKTLRLKLAPYLAMALLLLR